MRFIFLTIILSLIAIQSSWCATYFVSLDGNDRNQGTIDKPFRTIQKASNTMRAGDICNIQQGTYRESVSLKRSGSMNKPIRFIGALDENGRSLVTIDGTDPVNTEWTPTAVNGKQVYSTTLKEPTTQVFYKTHPMTEARWPDQKFEQIWNRSTWAKSSKGSLKGTMISSELSDTNVDWTGAIAVLNVGHQFKTWVRKVDQHKAGSTEFTYTLTERMSNGKEDGHTWWDDSYYLFGKIEALTSPEEWYFDDQSNRLLFYPPKESKPAPGDVHIKVREIGISGRNIHHVEISGINFFGCTLDFSRSSHITVENCDILFPNYSRMLTDTAEKGKRRSDFQTRLDGRHNTVRKVRVAYGNTGGIQVSGKNNTVENCIVHDVCWAGNLHHPGIVIRGTKEDTCDSSVSGSTIYNVGNVGILHQHGNNRIEFNHVYNTGLACKDIAAIHTGSPRAAGGVVAYNWVHDSMGKGIRGDDQTRGLTFHHNVIWNCDEGMILKGDFNKCYNNTILGEGGHGCLIIPTRAEPRKWWAKHAFLDVQNANSAFANNLVESLIYRHDPLPDNKRITNNVELEKTSLLKRFLEAASDQSFQSLADEVGAKVGAYVAGEKAWTPGADWNPLSIGIHLPIQAEVAHSRVSVSANKPAVRLPKFLLESRLSPVSKTKLQDLYNDCWTPEEIGTRKSLIRQRAKLSKDSEEYKNLQTQVISMHQTAKNRLRDRAGEVLAGSELTLFHEIVP